MCTLCRAHHTPGSASSRRFRHHGRETLPDPPSEHLTRRVLQALDLVQVVVVEPIEQRLHRTPEISKVSYPPAFVTYGSSDVDGDTERVTVKTRALVAGGN